MSEEVKEPGMAVLMSQDTAEPKPSLLIRDYVWDGYQVWLRGHWFRERPTAIDYTLDDGETWHRVLYLTVWPDHWRGRGPTLEEPGVVSLRVRDHNRPHVQSQPITIGAEPLGVV
jgi:hypothetical protein